MTRGLVDTLTVPELEAVLAHELSHLVNRDAAVMTAVSSPRTLGEVVVSGAGEGLGLLWLAGWPLGLFPYVIGTGLTLTVSRSFLSDHPPLEKRLAALAQIQREMGRAVG